MRNDPDFVFESYGFDSISGVLTLSYRFESGIRFVERITFPDVPADLSPVRKAALDRACQTIFYLAGVSYYKAYTPRIVRFDSQVPDTDTAKFLQNVYTKGLAEFAYENGIDIRERVSIKGQGKAETAPIAGLSRRALVPVGGGKDSIVSIEGLKAAGQDITLFALGGPSGAATPIADTIRVSGLPHIYVTRQLAPEIGALNAQGALNGHVPITAILSAIAVACAVLYDFDAVVLSNEHSASAPNIMQGAWDVNHQYSKSLEFERDFAAHVRAHIAADLRYFSLLRPLSEAAIARRFATHGAYHDVFRSCNTAFRQDAGRRGTQWCCDCPKCRFVFLALAPFISKDHLVAVFGENLLDNPAQVHGFKQLCGIADFKPFECVGETEESALLMEVLLREPAWADDVAVKACAKQGPDFEARFAALLAVRPDHDIPDDFAGVL